MMENSPRQEFWKKRLEKTRKALLKHGFNAFVAQNRSEGERIFDDLFLKIRPASVAWGGSMTIMGDMDLGKKLKKLNDCTLIDAYDPALTPEEAYECRRRGLLADMFLCGTNAVVCDGTLVNLDGTGNRVAALTFGPKNVIVFAGRNKIVETLEEAVSRTRTIAAPANAIRLNRKTPCSETGVCVDCSSPDRICNQWGILARCNPVNRVNVILINEELGY